MLWPEKEPAERKVPSRLAADKLHQPQCWFQLGDPPTETKFSPSKAIFPQEHHWRLTMHALPLNRGSLPARSVLRHSSDSERCGHPAASVGVSSFAPDA